MKRNGAAISKQPTTEPAVQQVNTVFLDNLPIPIQIYRPDGFMLTMNRASEAYWKVSREATTNFNVLQDPQMVKQGIPDLLQRAAQGEVIVTQPHSLDTADIGVDLPETRKNWVISTYFPICDQTGEVAYLGVMNRDVTAEMESQQRHKRQTALERRFSDAIFDTAGLLIVVLASDGAIVRLNSTAERLMGYTQAEVQGCYVWDIFLLPEEIEPVKGVFQQLHAGMFPNSYENYWLSRSGEARLIAWNNTAMLDEDGRVEYVLGTGIDITERKRAEEQQRTLATVVENTTDFVGIAGLDGQVRFVNEAGCWLVGLGSKEAARQTNISDYLFPEDVPFTMEQILPTVIETGAWRGEFRFRHFQTGEAIPVDYNLFVVRDDHTGKIHSLVTVTRDIREQKRQEAERAAIREQIIEAQQAALRELSTPLLPISDDAVVLPLVGTIDSGRAQQVMETLLEGVARHQARLAIVDITGVQVVDTQVADALIRAARAVKLLGAQVILTGIQPQIAQTLVHLGVDLRDLQTRGSLQAGIAAALQQAG